VWFWPRCFAKNGEVKLQSVDVCVRGCAWVCKCEDVWVDV